MIRTIRQRRTLAEPNVLKRRTDWRRVRADMLVGFVLITLIMLAVVGAWWLVHLLITLMPE